MSERRRLPRILLVGPLPIGGSPIGGTAVSFAELVDRCRRSTSLEFDVVDTARRGTASTVAGRMWSDLRTLTRVLVQVARRTRRCEAVLFHASPGALLSAGPFVWAIARSWRKPLAVRPFGGAFDDFYDALPSWRRFLADRTVLSASLVLMQTHSLCARFAHCDTVEWFPTTRSVRAATSRSKRSCRAFLFMAQLRPEKGLAEALAASDRLPDGATLTVHGPWMSGPDLRVFDDHPKARYGGVVERENVPDVLAAHDALVFPSYYPGEGLPGVVIEALQNGMPVIAALWRQVPDVVQHGISGLIVPPRSVEALSDAMTRLVDDDELFARLARGAEERGQDFSADRWQLHLEDRLLALTSRAPGNFQDQSRRSEPASSEPSKAPSVARANQQSIAPSERSRTPAAAVEEELAT